MISSQTCVRNINPCFRIFGWSEAKNEPRLPCLNEILRFPIDHALRAPTLPQHTSSMVFKCLSHCRFSSRRLNIRCIFNLICGNRNPTNVLNVRNPSLIHRISRNTCESIWASSLITVKSARKNSPNFPICSSIFGRIPVTNLINAIIPAATRHSPS